MPMSETQREVWELSRTGLSHQQIADRLGISKNSVSKRLMNARKWEEAPEGQKAAVEVSGLDIGIARHGWRVINHDDGSRDSVFWVADNSADAEAREDRLVEKFQSIPAAPRIARAEKAASELRVLYPLFDVHLGRSYKISLEEATGRVIEGMQSLVSQAEPAETAIILNGGDWTEQNDPSNQTPKSKHPLDAHDYDETIDAAIDTTALLIEMALQKHQRVIYKPLRGNHDPHTAQILRIGMAQRYRENPQVEIDGANIVFMSHRWKNNLLLANHGDAKVGPEKMCMWCAAKYPRDWGETEHRELFTGHTHHLKSAEFPGVSWYQCRPIAATGRYEDENAFGGKSEMLSVTYHAQRGRIFSNTYIF